MRRVPVGRVLLGVCVVFVVLGLTDVVERGVRIGVGLALGMLIIRIGLASFGPLHPRGETGPARDVVLGEDAVPLYVCTGCGTQLVLLRKGTDKPPRHCGEPMLYREVTDPAADLSADLDEELDALRTDPQGP